jgi:hypothetical protein
MDFLEERESMESNSNQYYYMWSANMKRERGSSDIWKIYDEDIQGMLTQQLIVEQNQTSEPFTIGSVAYIVERDPIDPLSFLQKRVSTRPNEENVSANNFRRVRVLKYEQTK